MIRSVLNELHKQIIYDLTEKEFLKNTGISEEKMLSYLINNKFLKNLSNFINKESITCQNVLDMCADILNSRQAEPPEGWMAYAFQYVLNKSFPDAVTIKLNPIYEVPVIIYLQILRSVTKFSQVNGFGSVPKFEFLTDDEIRDLPNKRNTGLFWMCSIKIMYTSS